MKEGCGMDCQDYAKTIRDDLETPGIESIYALPQRMDCFVVFSGNKRVRKRVSALECTESVEPNAEVWVGQEQPWGIDRIDQPSLPLDARPFSSTYTGAGQTVYVLDTGLYPSHSEFAEVRRVVGFDVIKETPWTDGHGHGTHVAATVVGRRVGIARKAELIAVKVLNKYGSGTIAGVIEGLQWVIESATKPSVVSMSLGGSKNRALTRAVAAVAKAGHVVVSAAGNSRSDACKFSPANSGGRAKNTGVVTVAATTIADSFASYSNHGKCVDILAPGTGILSATNTGATDYRTLSGTSMACPHVSGVVALLLEKYDGDRKLALTELLDLARKDTITSLPKSTPNLFLYIAPANGTSYCSRFTKQKHCKADRQCRWGRPPSCEYTCIGN
jgi:subtilisin family serine protease